LCINSNYPEEDILVFRNLNRQAVLFRNALAAPRPQAVARVSKGEFQGVDGLTSRFRKSVAILAKDDKGGVQCELLRFFFFISNPLAKRGPGEFGGAVGEPYLPNWTRRHFD